MIQIIAFSLFAKKPASPPFEVETQNNVVRVYGQGQQHLMTFKEDRGGLLGEIWGAESKYIPNYGKYLVLIIISHGPKFYELKVFDPTKPERERYLYHKVSQGGLLQYELDESGALKVTYNYYEDKMASEPGLPTNRSTSVLWPIK